MMSIVVDDPHALNVTFRLEAALGTVELTQTFHYIFKVDADVHSRGNSRKSIQYIVLTVYLQHYSSELFTVVNDIKINAVRGLLDIGGYVVSLIVNRV